MGLICIAGLDRTGKTTVAEWYETQGYQVIHLSAPDKKYTQPGFAGSSYFEDYVDMLMSFNGKDVVMDRFWDGELVWPKIYDRKSLLSEEEIDTIREIEETMGVKYILMHDPNNEAHWQRCVENNEPLTKPQFVKARSLFSSMADKYGFERKTLKDFPDAVQPLPVSQPKAPVQVPVDTTRSERDNGSTSTPVTSGSNKTKEQLKLERANIINEVLDKRIIKGKGPMYDDVERTVRHFLNTELGKILGTQAPVNASNFSNEEVELLKFFCQKLKDKETR